MFELMDGYSELAEIKVLGIGGGGGNAVAYMAKTGIEGVDFICANTDAQALKGAKVRTGIQIGKRAFYRQIEMPLAEAYRHASAVMVENMMEADAREGIGAFIDKRDPKFDEN